MEKMLTSVTLASIFCGVGLSGSKKFRNFAVRFIKSCMKMSISIIIASNKTPVVMNWGYLENWKSTASMGC